MKNLVAFLTDLFSPRDETLHLPAKKPGKLQTQIDVLSAKVATLEAGAQALAACKRASEGASTCAACIERAKR